MARDGGCRERIGGARCRHHGPAREHGRGPDNQGAGVGHMGPREGPLRVPHRTWRVMAGADRGSHHETGGRGHAVTTLRLYLALSMLRTSRRLHLAAGQIIDAVEYRSTGIHRAELAGLALMVGIGVAGVWPGMTWSAMQ